MEVIRKFLLVITGLVMAMVTMILVMIYGWGLQPKSWWWIIGMNLLGNILSQLFILVSRDKKIKKQCQQN